MNSKRLILLSVVFGLLFLFFDSSSAQREGFVSLDCGGKEPYTDEIGLKWIPDSIAFGTTVKIVSNETRAQYQNLRYFPADSRKYCYTFNVLPMNKYLVRASFLSSNFNKPHADPIFDVSLGATHWATIAISDPNVIETRELIFFATSPTTSVCLYNATSGYPFISTLELRPLDGSMYLTGSENVSYLSVSARINFGALSAATMRYPDDEFDRLWQSDLLQKDNYLQDVDPGTVKVLTGMPIEASWDERPPQNVMRSGVVGANGSLTYRLNLDGLPGSGWAITYFSEIDYLAENKTRKFTLNISENDDTSKIILDIKDGARGNNRLYERRYTNLFLPSVFSFAFRATPDSSRGPLVNAIEIHKYLSKTEGSADGPIVANMVSHYSSNWALEGGDPCLPVPWSWIQCNSTSQPKILLVKLSGKNMGGIIPTELTTLTGLTELWLDGNALTGHIPDFTACLDLRIIHLENNNLTGNLPSWLAKLPNLKELYVQNNNLSGLVPQGLLYGKDLVLNYSGNVNLHAESSIMMGPIAGTVVLLVFIFVSCFCIWKRMKKGRNQEEKEFSLPVQQPISPPSDPQTGTISSYNFREIEEATENFKRKIGSGGFGTVYYGKMRDGKEIAVKVLASNSCQGKREFRNEVTLLSKIHHRNLVQLLGYCEEDSRSMLIYAFMHNGTLKEHLRAPQARGRTINWTKRLEIAEDSARGIEYLHIGCIPPIIHRDLKSSNILLDEHMRAKVADFGFSKLAVEGVSHESSTIRGTIGYLDPEYYLSRRLTEKSDVYSFGVILFELMSGQDAISKEKFGDDCCTIVKWANSHIECGNIEAIIDPALGNEYNVQSMWKIADIARTCVQYKRCNRPSMSEVLRELQQAISLEQCSATRRAGYPDKSFNSGSVDAVLKDILLEDLNSLPRAR